MSEQMSPAWPNDEPDPNDVGELTQDQASQAEEEALEAEELDELEREEGLPPGRIPLPGGADVGQAMRADYEREDLDESE